ncbi:aspartyl/asparaginyl beta-hydroxylase domain-containing protein [Novilysobacter selenitireducens]|uniref:Aspartyl/asparaginyl beta-hydroxylase domain-containing protein n=1 Tax=Novilysobacter selenitireducens TaxID=2872639 RepID=A0ABS7T6A7_9GAMM|nr:aspartyl/asparaginyl beta-hydroxylase domain-containing protein [Lysobacter selenitireducens]MBZ4039383.1 aspartyl/asparaginyl beta-hydroxylase domain-containing protein [Lysobacter selenitireducens]
MYANPRKTESIRRLGPVDIAALRQAVLRIDEARWDAENADKPNRFEALDRTRHIVFRFVSNFQDWRDSYDRPLWGDWKGLLEPVLAQAVRDYGYKDAAFPRVMLARMAPGGVIKPHRDANPAAKWPHKIHVPLVTNDKVTFFVDGVGYHFPEGEAVEVSNMAVHAVENAGDTDRIHLIFEYYDREQPEPEWLAQLPPRPAMR